MFDKDKKGNYWSDYTDRYPEATNDGTVWNTPYIVATEPGQTNNLDRYPLVHMADLVPPTAVLEREMVVDEGTTVTFNGSASSDNVGISMYSWDFYYDDRWVSISGPTPKFTFDIPGRYVIALVVYDTFRNYDSASMNLTVLDIHAPVAIAGPDKVVSLNSEVALDGTASHDSSGIVGYTWTVTMGGIEHVLHGETVSLLCDTFGTFQVALQVTDGTGKTGEDGLQLTVTDTEPPIIVLDLYMETEQGLPTTLDASGSMDDVGISEYIWDIDVGGHITVLKGPMVNFTFNRSGLFSVQLTVTDEAGNSANAKMNVYVIDTEPPVPRPGPDREVVQGTKVTLDGTDSTDNVEVVGYLWWFTYNGIKFEKEEPIYSFNFLIVGEYVVYLIVTDGRYNSAEGTFVLTVVDTEPPWAAEIYDITIDQGQEQLFKDAGSTDNVGVERIAWTFEYDGKDILLEGDDSPFTFDIVGEYLVTLIVEDLEGNQDTVTFTVTVMDAEDPIAFAGEARRIENTTELLLDGSGSGDNVGVTNFTWTIVGPGTDLFKYGAMVTQQLTIPGNYTVTLTVKDAAGNSGSHSINVEVYSTYVEPEPDPRKPDDEPAGTPYWLIGIIAVVVLVVAVAIVMWTRQRKV